MQPLPLDQYVRDLIVRIGFTDAAVSADPENRRGAIRLAELELEARQLQEVVEALNHVVARYAERAELAPIFFDVNGYRAEREALIAKLADAAAERAASTGQPVELPSMNSYERRLVHGRIGERSGVVSESTGMGKERRVTIRRAE